MEWNIYTFLALVQKKLSHGVTAYVAAQIWTWFAPVSFFSSTGWVVFVGLLSVGEFPLLSPPHCLWWCYLPPLPLAVRQKNTLGQTVHCLLIPPANRNAISQRSSGCSGQAEMPDCIGVSPPRQVVPGLHLVFICLLVVEFLLYCIFVLTLFHAVLFQFCVDFSVFLCKMSYSCRMCLNYLSEGVFAKAVLPLLGKFKQLVFVYYVTRQFVSYFWIQVHS